MISCYLRRYLLVALLLPAVAHIQAYAATEVVVYADDNYPPYSYKEAGEAKGIYTELLRRAFAKMEDYSVRIEAVPWKRGLSYLEQGTGFALYPPYERTAKRPYIRPYSTPLRDEKVVVYCRQDIMTEPRPEWPVDYYGLKIGSHVAYAMVGDVFRAALKEGKVKLIEGNSNRDMLVLLAKKRIDCFVNERLSILWTLQQMRASGEYDEIGIQNELIEGATISMEPSFVGYTARDEGRFPFKADFIARLNALLDEMKASGEMQRITEEFIK